MIFSFGRFELDEEKRELRRGGETVALQPLVFDLLAVLVRNHQRVVSKDELLKTLWPDGFVTEASLERVVSLSRSALNDKARTLIRTYPRHGYRFCGEVESGVTAQSAVQPSGPGAATRQPRVQYARTSDGMDVAFHTVGTGPAFLQMMMVGGHIRQQWLVPEFRRWYERLARSRMLVQYDHRGTGLSSRDVTDFSPEALGRDLDAVAERLGLDRFALWATGGMGPVAISYAVRNPERVSHLILWCAFGRPAEVRKSPQMQALRGLVENWELYTDTLAHYFFGWPGGDPARTWAAMLRDGVTMETYRLFQGELNRCDVTDLLSEVKTPTLVLHRRQYPLVGVDVARDLACRIANARLVLLEGESIGYALEDSQSVLNAIDDFLG